MIKKVTKKIKKVSPKAVPKVSSRRQKIQKASPKPTPKPAKTERKALQPKESKPPGVYTADQWKKFKELKVSLG